MEDRRTFLGIAAASLLPIGLDAQTAAAPPNGELARHALTGPFEGYEAILSLASIRHFPGASTPAHRHSSFVLAYVLEGQKRFAINNEPERIVPTGGTFFEPFGAVHTTSGSANPDSPVRILIFSVVPKGTALAGLPPV
jgi:quercetin dioxygenase-like cupin family protein